MALAPLERRGVVALRGHLAPKVTPLVRGQRRLEAGDGGVVQPVIVGSDSADHGAARGQRRVVLAAELRGGGGVWEGRVTRSTPSSSLAGISAASPPDRAWLAVGVRQYSTPTHSPFTLRPRQR